MSKNIYLVRSGESIIRANDRDRQLSLKALAQLTSLSKRITEDPPEIVFHSDTRRALHTAELLWPKVQKQKVTGLYTPIEQKLFTEAKSFLEKNNAEAIRSVWVRVHQKTEAEKALTNLYDLCYATANELIEKTEKSRVASFAIVGHEIILNLVGHFLSSVNIDKQALLNARFKNGEVRLIKTKLEQVLILSE